ncbi:membrane protein [Streptococcus pyogenes]|uniref:conjugal transfer protein n=1 Tax=Streptococcus pyogenes TaxID=1314 RepID=UPI00109C83AA|nr:conjugal transfer protein [Streptococcus pyogenes]VGV82018.1 membrane protein [Streptococcus pyogenes]
MQEAFEKLKGVDIFALKSYLEKTSIIETSIIVAMNEIFVNLFFFLLNLVVGFFSLMIRIMENIDLYDSYKTYVYNAAKSIWQGLTGSISGGLSSGSLVSMLLTIGAFYLFYQYFFSRGNFMRKVLHVLLVVLLGFGYFGTVASTSGGLYILDTVDNLADTVTSKISNISVSYGEDKSIKVGKSMADSYIAQTSYTAYVFVNTGQEKNRWVSAVWDYLFIKTFYVIFKIIEAIVIEVPIILVQLLNLIAQLLVLVMIFLFPIALLISFVPAMQDIIFGIFKVMFGGLVFPTITTLITLIIFYIEKVIETLITSGFDGVIESFPSLGTFALLFKLILSVVAKAAVYYFLWIYKGELIEFIMGSRARIKMEDIGNQVEDKVSQGKDLIQQMPSRNFEAAQHLGNFAMAGNGFVAGSAMNASTHIKEVGNFFRRSKPSEPAVEPNVPTDQPTEQPGPTPDQLPPTSSEPHIPKQDIPTDNPTQEKTPTPEATPSQPTTPPSPEMEFQELKEQWVSPRKQRKMERLEREFSAYDDAGAMYQAQGSNAFTRSFSQTMTRDDKIKANIERKNRLTQELNRLRGEQNEHY